jgi:superfamily II DNA or RNA helicase
MNKISRAQVKRDILKMPNRYLLLELPTSFGKSRIAIDIITHRNITPDKKILIVVPRLVLIDTWKDEFKKWGKEEYINNLSFVTYMSFPKRAGEWDMVVFDECHHLSPRCQEALKSYTIENSVLLSATVKRDMRYNLGVLFSNLGKYKVGIKDATEEGILPDPIVYLIPMSLDMNVLNHSIIKNTKKGNPIIVEYKDRWKYSNVKNRKVIIKCTQQQYYADITSLIEWYKKRKSNTIFKNLFLHKSGERLKWLSNQKTVFIHSLLDLLHKERTLVFCNSIAQTEELGKYCINSKNKESEEYLDKFNKGKIKHITACNMLDEGVNLVNCRIGIYATLNSSERMIIQKLGRLLRHPHPIIIIPYFVATRDEEIVRKMCENYNPNLIFTVNNINDLINKINGK